MMKIRFSRFRTFLFTFLLGSAVVAHVDDVPVMVPEAESDSPIIIRLCPKVHVREECDGSWNLYSEKGYQENGYLYFSKEKAMNCTIGGGGG